MSTNFKFTASPTDSENPLGFAVEYNHQTIFDTDQLQESREINIEIDDDDDQVNHVIRITLKNKTQAHTKIDEQGNIIKDSLITITNVSIDGIEIDQVFANRCRYTHSFNSDANAIVDDFFGVMGCNGVVEFAFTSPVYLWLLENL